MSEPETQAADTSESVARRRRAAGVVAVVAAVFSALVVGVMIATSVDEPSDEAVPTDVLTELRAALAANPTNEKLKTHIRNVDVAVRTRYYRNRQRFEAGAWLLLGGVIVMVGALRWRAALAPRLPSVERQADLADDDERRWGPAAWNLLAIGVMGAAVIATFVGFGGWGRERAAHAPVAPAASQPTAAPSATVTFKDNWTQFRGPTGMGLVPEGDWPTTWDAAAGKNVVWKCEIPLPGHNTPVVWGDRVYLTGADKTRRVVYAVDRASGRIVWQTPVPTRLREPPEVMEDTGYAPASPVTDGKIVAAMFATGDVVGVSADGKIAWQRYLGPPQSVYGLASSLALYKDTVIVQLDMGSSAEDGLSSILALEMATGKTVWQTLRDVPNSWCTPVVVNTGKRELLVTCADPWVIGYEPDSGLELWRANVLSGDVAPMPVYADGRVYVTNDASQVAAIRVGGSDDVTETHVVWTAEDGMPDTASPICDGRRFLQAANGLVTCLDAATGKLVWEQEFDNGFRASPSLVGKRVYLSDDRGITTVFELGDAYKVLSTGTLGEDQAASIVFGDSMLYIRGVKHLFCIGGGK